MAILLKNLETNTTIELPDQLVWEDEFSYSPIVQESTHTTTGALLIEEAVKKAGREITLVGEEDKSWCTRELVRTLQEWAHTPNLRMQLILRGKEYTVTFNHGVGAVEGLPVLFFADGSWLADDFYVPTLRFFEL